MKNLTLNKTVRCWLTAAILPITLAACNSEDVSIIIDQNSEDSQTLTVDPIQLNPVTSSNLGAFTQFEPFEVSGLADSEQVMLTVTSPFVFKVERNGEIITKRISEIPSVTDVDYFYSKGSFDINTFYKTSLPKGFTRFSLQVQNGDLVTIGSVASTKPETSLTGVAKIGLTQVPLLVTTGTADITPDSVIFDGAENSINAAPGEVLNVTFYVKGIDYPTPISIVTDETPKLDLNSSALGSARFTLGFDGIPGFEERLLESTTQAENTSIEQIEDSIAYLKAYYVPLAAVEAETAIRKSAQDIAAETGIPVDEVAVQAEVDTQVPLAEAAKALEIETAVMEAFSKYKQGQFIRLSAIAPDNYNQEAEVTLQIGTAQYTWLITTTEDTTPDVIALEQPSETIVKGGYFTSSPFTVTGINIETPISIANGEYSIDGGDFTSAPGVVLEGQTIRVKVQSSSVFSETTTATLELGGLTSQVTVQTEALDITPDTFDFGQTNAKTSQVVDSDSILITGFNDDVSVSITGGKYSINGGDFTANVGTLSPGQKVAVQLVSANTDGAEAELKLTVGGVDGYFKVVATAGLEGQTLFPPQNSFTEGDNIFLRGQLDTATNRTVTSVMVNEQTALVDGTNNTWSMEYLGLVDGKNTLRIKAEDSSGQIWEDEIYVTKGSGNFGGGIDFFGLHDVTVDMQRQKYYVLSSDQTWKGPINKLIEVDMATGARSLFVDTVLVNGVHSNSGGVKSSGVQYLPATQEVVVPNHVDDGIYKVPTSGDESSRVTNSSVLSGYKNNLNVGSGDNTNDPMEMAIDSERNKLIVANVNGNGGGIVSVDLTTGDRTQLNSDQAVSVAVNVDGIDGTTGDSYFYVPKTGPTLVYKLDLNQSFARSEFVTGLSDVPTLDVYRKGNALLLGDHGNKEVVKVDLDDPLQNQVLSKGTSGINNFASITAIATDETLGYLVLLDNANLALLAIDLETGNRVYLSKN